MTFDLGLTDIELHLDGILPTSTAVRVTLLSTYSNKEIWTQVEVDSFTAYDEWYTLDITNPNDYTNKDVEGYYVLTVEYNQTDWIELKRYLVKCINSADGNATPTSYVSDNENNEQIIFYQG